MSKITSPNTECDYLCSGIEDGATRKDPTNTGIEKKKMRCDDSVEEEELQQPHQERLQQPEVEQTKEEQEEQCLFVGCLTSQQQASVSQGRICTDNFTCCHTEIEVADPIFYLTQSQHTDTGPTSPSTDPITPDA